MTRAELTLAVNRHNRYRACLVNMSMVVALGFPWIGVYFTMRSNYSPEVHGDFIALLVLSAIILPILILASAFFVSKRFGIRCPHCQSFLGLEKKNVYDVTVTGRCRKCGRSVVDDMA